MGLLVLRFLVLYWCGSVSGLFWFFISSFHVREGRKNDSGKFATFCQSPKCLRNSDKTGINVLNPLLNKGKSQEVGYMEDSESEFAFCLF